ncbi:MAG: erythromycin esterase family protein [Bacteroidetes bacterium]|nr:erythromycin esterase family protein [Bacteroidota bacterium]
MIRTIREQSRKLRSAIDLGPLIESIGNARIVVLGAADRGTHEFYQWRTLISQRLIREKGFDFVALEEDWDDCTALNRYIKGAKGAATSAADALKQERWPAWPLANWEIVAMGEWMADHLRLNPDRSIALYGLDRYDQRAAMEILCRFAEKKYPVDMEKAHHLLDAFEMCYPCNNDRANGFSGDEALVRKLIENLLRSSQMIGTIQNGSLKEDVARKYFCGMLTGGVTAWNLRSEHLVDTLSSILSHHGPQSKGVIWAHNNVVGDTRATQSRMKNLISLGERIRKQFVKENVRLIGMGSYSGSSLGAPKWGAHPIVYDVPAANPSSWEGLLHASGPSNKWLLTKDLALEAFINTEIMQRNNCSIIDHSQIDDLYLKGILPYQYDAFLFFDRCKPLHPLHVQSEGLPFPEEYPFTM